jgi:hypothetical protein
MFFMAQTLENRVSAAGSLASCFVLGNSLHSGSGDSPVRLQRESRWVLTRPIAALVAKSLMARFAKLSLAVKAAESFHSFCL